MVIQHTTRRAQRVASTACVAALVAFAGSGGCGDDRDAWPPTAARIEFGIDACVECRMIVSDERFAAQYHVRGGAPEFFDDLGCLLSRHVGSDCDPAGVFVREFAGNGWVRGDEGFVLRSGDLASPMGYGLAVYAQREPAEAERVRRSGATVVPLSTLLREGISRPETKGANDPPGPS